MDSGQSYAYAAAEQGKEGTCLGLWAQLRQRGVRIPPPRIATEQRRGVGARGCLVRRSPAALTAVSAGGQVVAAAPGMVTSADLPLRAFAGRFAGA